VRRIWDRDAALWGAFLDGGDNLAGKGDLARQAASIHEAEEPAPEPREAVG
jgi:hypothetical protein